MQRSLAEQQFGPSAAHYATSAVHAAGESLAMLTTMLAPAATWRVLDVATGAGHMAAAIAPHVREVVASDVTAEMLAEAARLFAQRGLSNVVTASADAGELGFATASFDAVVCRLAAHHFASVPAFLNEASRVLRPGGRLGLVDNVAPDAEMLTGASAAEIAATDAGYDAFERLRDPSHVRAFSRQEWRGSLARAGFEMIAEELIEKELAFEPWVERMRCTPETVTQLKAMLQSGSLCAFLKPRGSDSDRHFVLREYLLVARKPD